MALRDETPKVGVYINFENLHATFADAQFGDGSYRDNRMSVQPTFFDIVPILHYAASLGDVVICKAYANWQFFSNYRHVLNEGSVDLIQLFPRGANMKNSADIRLALDCLSDAHGQIECQPSAWAAKRQPRPIAGADEGPVQGDLKDGFCAAVNQVLDLDSKRCLNCGAMAFNTRRKSRPSSSDSDGRQRSGGRRQSALHRR